jgi:hypothetical protein
LNILKENVPLKKEQFDMLRQHRHQIRKLASKLVSDKQKETIVQNGGGLLDDIITPSLCHLTVNIDEHQRNAFDKDTEDSNASDATCSSWSRYDSDERDTDDSSCSSWSRYDPDDSDTDVSDDDAKSTESEETGDERQEIDDSEENEGVEEDDDDNDDKGNEAESIYSHKPVLIGSGVAFY